MCPTPYPPTNQRALFRGPPIHCDSTGPLDFVFKAPSAVGATVYFFPARLISQRLTSSGPLDFFSKPNPRLELLYLFLFPGIPARLISEDSFPQSLSICVQHPFPQPTSPLCSEGLPSTGPLDFVFQSPTPTPNCFLFFYPLASPVALSSTSKWIS